MRLTCTCGKFLGHTAPLADEQVRIALCDGCQYELNRDKSGLLHMAYLAKHGDSALLNTLEALENERRKRKPYDRADVNAATATLCRLFNEYYGDLPDIEEYEPQPERFGSGWRMV